MTESSPPLGGHPISPFPRSGGTGAACKVKVQAVAAEEEQAKLRGGKAGGPGWLGAMGTSEEPSSLP